MGCRTANTFRRCRGRLHKRRRQWNSSVLLPVAGGRSTRTPMGCTTPRRQRTGAAPRWGRRLPACRLPAACLPAAPGATSIWTLLCDHLPRTSCPADRGHLCAAQRERAALQAPEARHIGGQPGRDGGAQPRALPRQPGCATSGRLAWRRDAGLRWPWIPLGPACWL